MTERRDAPVSFDIDEWIHLWKTDPEEAERRRAAEIEAVIGGASEERRPGLRRLQWRIDMERMRHDNPMGRCIALNRMLMDHLWSERGLYSVGPKLLFELSCELEELFRSSRSVVAPADVEPVYVEEAPVISGTQPDENFLSGSVAKVLLFPVRKK